MKDTYIKPSIVFVSTYPPRECGIATFTRDLATAFQSLVIDECDVKVAAINKTNLDTLTYPTEVKWQIDQDSSQDYRVLADNINSDETVRAVIIQHEYGIFGEQDGSYILELTKNLHKPYVLSMHTVLSQPSASLKNVTQQLIENAQAVIVLSQESKKILENIYESTKTKIHFVPHGIHPQLFLKPSQVKPKLKLANKTVVATFGLLSRGKGIEYVISSLPEVVEKHPDLVYLILGQTHPVIRKTEGESYRHELMQLVKNLGLEKHVIFHDHYLTTENILTYLQATDVYIATSLSPEQSVSGTFSYALGAGRAVISTAFRQATEVITPEVGRLVPMKNSVAYSNALLELLSNQDALHQMHQEAYRRTRSMVWSNVAHEYCELLATIPDCQLSKQWYAPDPTIRHLEKMTDHFGFLQFSTYAQPDPEFGYTLDDNARALVVLLRMVDEKLVNQMRAMPLIQKYFSFIQQCRLKDGSFINYLSGDNQTVTGQNADEDLSDCVGRVCWAFGEIIGCDWLPTEMKYYAEQALSEILPSIATIKHLRSKAFALLGICQLRGQKPELTAIIEKLASSLTTSYQTHHSENWEWFEEKLTYANGLLPLALFKAGTALQNNTMIEIAKKTLNFLTKQCFFGDMYIPIGQRIWSNSDGTRGFF